MDHIAKAAAAVCARCRLRLRMLSEMLDEVGCFGEGCAVLDVDMIAHFYPALVLFSPCTPF